MRVLIIGGTGFIGPYVVHRLLELGHDVVVAHTGGHEHELTAAAEHLHHPALRRAFRAWPEELVGELRARRPDVVLDMAPLGESDAQLVVDTFRGIAGRVVGIGSADVYRNYGLLHGSEAGEPDPVPLAEDAPLRTRLYPYRGEEPRAEDAPDRWVDVYDKILVERALLGRLELPGTMLRLPMTYGPGDGQHRLYGMGHLKRMDDRRPAILLDERYARWRTCWGYVENVAAAIALVVVDARAAGRVYNVSEAETPTMQAWVGRVGRAADWQGKVVPVPPDRLPESLRWHDAPDLTTDSSRIRRELGYTEPVPVDEALRRTVAWERANPPELDAAKYDYAAEDEVLAALS